MSLILGVVALLLLVFVAPLDGRRDGAWETPNFEAGSAGRWRWLFRDRWHLLKALAIWPFWLLAAGIVVWAFGWWGLGALGPLAVFCLWRWTVGMRAEKRRLGLTPWKTSWDKLVALFRRVEGRLQ